MTSPLVVEIDDLIGRPDASRAVSGSVPVSLRLVDTLVEGEMAVDAVIRGTVDGVHAEFAASATGTFVCSRCLTEWEGPVEVGGSQHFSKVADEDGYVIEEGHIDLAGPAMDELALGLPAAPLCKKDCKGLCPICGSDLNRDPCAGHGDDSDSPFAVLKDLFDS